jgi:hypothetical protein
VVIIGPGQPSLIERYKSLTQCPFEIYADPTTTLYSMLGMYRTLSMGKDSPDYIEHSLLSGGVKSAWQILKRIPKGDALSGGNWDVNGGEFLFTRLRTRSRSSSRTASSRSRSRSRSPWSKQSDDHNWQISWCHRMRNSRDHSEILDLHYQTCFSVIMSPTTSSHPRTASPAPALKPILLNNAGKKLPKTPARSYSYEIVGACPAPEVPKIRPETTRPRARSRSTSATRSTAKQNHDRVWAQASNADISRGGSTTSLVLPIHEHDGAASEPAEVDKEPQPRKSITACVTDRLPILKRNASTGEASNPYRLPRTSSLSNLRSHSVMSITPNTKPRSRAISNPMLLLRSKSKTKSLLGPSSTSPPTPPAKTHSRTRTFSFSKSDAKDKPLPPPKSTPSDKAKISSDGVTHDGGAEFVNIISANARVFEPAIQNNRMMEKELHVSQPNTGRDRSDSGFASLEDISKDSSEISSDDGRWSDNEDDVDTEVARRPPVPAKESKYAHVKVTALSVA